MRFIFFGSLVLLWLLLLLVFFIFSGFRGFRGKKLYLIRQPGMGAQSERCTYGKTFNPKPGTFEVKILSFVTVQFTGMNRVYMTREEPRQPVPEK